MNRVPAFSRIVARTTSPVALPALQSPLRCIAVSSVSPGVHLSPAVSRGTYGNADAKAPWWGGSAKSVAAAVGAVALYSGTQCSVSHPAHCDDGGKAEVKTAEAKPTLLQKLVAEACGTGIIVLGGCGCVAAKVYCNSGIAIGAVAATWGMSVALAAYTTRDISGAHLNPAVTAALAVNKPDAIPKSHVIPYWCAQIFGATVAGAINFITFNAAILAYEAENAIKRGAVGSFASCNGAFGMIPNAACTTPAGAFLIEVFSTAMLLYLIFSITDPNSTVPEGAGPALVGATVAILLTTFAPLTGAGLNPARDLGPRLITYLAGWGTEALSSWWVYTSGPLLGGILGGAVYQASCAK